MNDHKTFLRDLTREGYIVTRTTKQHLRIRHPEMAGFVVVGCTPGDIRNMRNVTALLRRKRREFHQPGPHG
jgi:predicted RNA binding protein YcfA (HicA-like mRNA interferase family)